MRRIVVGAALLAMSACGMAREVTRADRVAMSTELSKRPAGSQVTDRELALADQDKTVVCENRMVVGSHIPQRRCRTMRQIEEEKRPPSRGARVAASRVVTAPATPTSGGWTASTRGRVAGCQAIVRGAAQRR